MRENTKFTSGPWVTDRSHPEFEGITIWDTKDGVIIAHVVRDQHEEMEANALLISQAPDLLGALEELVAAKQAEETYRWESIGSYPDTKIPDEVRQQWLADLSKITTRQMNAWHRAKDLLQKAKGA